MSREISQNQNVPINKAKVLAAIALSAVGILLASIVIFAIAATYIADRDHAAHSATHWVVSR